MLILFMSRSCALSGTPAKGTLSLLVSVSAPTSTALEEGDGMKGAAAALSCRFGGTASRAACCATASRTAGAARAGSGEAAGANESRLWPSEPWGPGQASPWSQYEPATPS